MKKKTRVFIDYVTGRLTEPSTWQGIGFLVALTGSKVGMGLDWGQAAGLGGIISAAIKMAVPDKKS
jgi:hypothetical protein